MKDITRRNFLETAAAAGILGALTACDTTAETGNGTHGSGSKPAPSSGSEEEPEAEPEPVGPPAPDASTYPISPDGAGVDALYTTSDMRGEWTCYENEDGPKIGVFDQARMIQVDGYAFRDINGDGKLDLFEDWRQSDEDRAAALAEAMEIDEMLPLMFNNGLNSASAPLDDNTKATLANGARAGVSRAAANENTYASVIEWMNAVQAECEGLGNFAIPYLNDTDQYQLFNIPANVSLSMTFDPEMFAKAGEYLGKAWRNTGVWCLLGPQVDITTHPTYVRFAGSVSEDPALNRDFAAYFTGALQSTYDDAGNDLGWGEDSVLGMLKHYVGAGATEGGRNDHYDDGSFAVFPGNNFAAHLVPFLDGGLKLASKTGQMAAIMPNYSIAFSDDEEYGENVAGGYSKERNGILRNAGWDGMITTDWQILDNMYYGVSELSEPERFAKMVDAGDSQVGGSFSPDVAREGYRLMVDKLGEDEAAAQIREACRRIFVAYNHVGLFDNPFTDRQRAKEIFDDETYTDFGLEASDKSICMLKNAGPTITKNGLGGEDHPKVYVPIRTIAGNIFAGTEARTELTLDEGIANDHFEVISDESQIAECDYAVIRVQNPQDARDGNAEGAFRIGYQETQTTYAPISIQYRDYVADSDSVRTVSVGGKIIDGEKENRSYYGQSTFASNESDLDAVIDLRSKMKDGAKLILMVEADGPMVFSEIEPYVDVILFTYAFNGDGGDQRSWARIITGEVEPTALLNAQMPASMEDVEASCEDVPFDCEAYVDSEGNAYEFGFGLNWSGVISDERTEKYCVAPLTEPETEWSW